MTPLDRLKVADTGRRSVGNLWIVHLLRPAVDGETGVLAYCDTEAEAIEIQKRLRALAEDLVREPAGAYR